MSYQSLVAFEGWTFIAQILNLFIQMYLFKKFLFKPIQNILAQRQQEVDTLYADADSAKQDAESAKAEYEGHLLTARTEAEEITERAPSRMRRPVLTQCLPAPKAKRRPCAKRPAAISSSSAAKR